MGRAAAVLARLSGDARRRLAAGALLVAALAAYVAAAGVLPDLPLELDVLVVSGAAMPAAFALVLLALPLREHRGLLGVAAALAVLAIAWSAAGFESGADLAKLAATAAVGFWFLSYFERLSWVVAVAAVIPLVDAVSVWRGPTRHIVTEEPGIFSALSIAFPVPEGSFELGLPDVLFFSLFVAAAARWRLRVGWTWAAMLAALAATIALAIWVDPFGIGGVPALPGLSLAFLAVNADLLLRRLR